MLSRIPHLTSQLNRSTYHRFYTSCSSSSRPHLPRRPVKNCGHRVFSVRSATSMAAPTDTLASETASELQLTPEALTSTLKSKLAASHVRVEDMSGGCGQAFNAIIVSDQFNGKTALARHRLVNNALKREIAAIHAWTPRCLTPEQWEKEQAR